MKQRPIGFLSERCIDHDSAAFDYIAELHDYLWRVIRIAKPGSSGNLGALLDDAIKKLEENNE